MATYYISSGTTVSGLTLHSDDSENIFSGGSVVATTVSSGGTEFVYSGGSAIGTTVASGGLEFLYSGASTGGTDVSSGGTLLVLPGASATATSAAAGASVLSTGVVIASGQQVVSAAPTITGGVSGAETELVLQGGVALSATISGSLQAVFSGGLASATSLSFGVEQILSSGVADATSVGGSGTERVGSGGLASGAAVGSGGVLIVASGGVASGGTVGAGGLEMVSSGGSASDASVASGGTLIELPGGATTGITSAAGAIVASTGFVVLSGAEALSAGTGAASGLSLGFGESAVILPGGSAVSVTISGGALELFSATVSFTTISYGAEEVGAGATALSTTVSGGYQEIASGGIASGADVASGGYQDISGSAVGVVVHGAQYVASGGVATAATLIGGSQYVYSGGLASDTLLSSGSYETVSAGGTADATSVGSAALAYVDYGATVSGAHVLSGGAMIVLPHGTAEVTAVDSGGLVISTGVAVLSGTHVLSDVAGAFSGNTLSAGQSELVLPSGSAVGVTIDAAGTLYDYSLAQGTTILAGGTVQVNGGGVATGTTLQGGVDFIYSGGSGAATTVSSGVEYVSSAGVASDTVLLGGNQYVYSRGLAIGTQIGSGSFQYVSSGGSASGTMVGSGGAEDVGTLGVASGTSVGSGALLYVFSTAAISGATIGDGGIGYVSAGASAAGTDIKSGGLLLVLPGGSATGTRVETGGVLASTGVLVLSGTTVVAFGDPVLAGTTVTSGETEFVLSGGSAVSAVITSGGADLVFSGGVASGDVIESGGKEEIAGGTATDTTMLPGGTIELEAYSYSSGGTVSLNSSTDALTVITGGQTYAQQMAGDYSDETFRLAPDPILTIAPDVLLLPACFCRGTRIAIPGGEAAVEDLGIGDRVLTAGGEARPIRWIGRRSYDGRFVAGNRNLLPVLIRVGALQAEVPRRDLRVSPNHAIYIDGVLIPAVELVNGRSIEQIDNVEQVEYFHIELDTHDILLAEGAPAESFVDDLSRGIFHNAAEYAELYPEAAPGPAIYCAPRVEGGEELQAVRARLARESEVRPGGGQADAPLAPLIGYLDSAEAGRIHGWAQNPEAPDERVRVAIVDNGITIAEVVADLHRDDLAEAGVGDGGHAFELIPPRPLDPRVRHVMQARRASDGRELGLSPQIVASVAEPAAPEPAEPEPPAVLTAPAEPSRPLDGYLDSASRERLRGWAREPDSDEPVVLQVLDNGRPIARVIANMFREDLERVGFGRGRHAFDVLIPGGLSPLPRHVVEVRRESDGAMLKGAPAVIEPETSFGPALERAVAHAVEAVADGERERVLSFLTEQSERLRQLRADTEGRRSARDAARRLRRRWGPEAERHGLVEPGERALVIDARVPRPDRDAGSQALLSHIRALGRLGYGVSFVAADEMAHAGADAAGEGVACCRAPFYASLEDVLRRQADCFDVVYLHRASVAHRYQALVRQNMPRARVLYSVADLHWLRLERQAAVEDLPELVPESRRLRFIECTAAWTADAVITHSAHEAALLRAAVPAARVHCVPWEVPARPTRTTFAERRGLGFIGHYGHVPNQDAAYWLVEEIMPRVWQSDPAIECLLVGSDMPDSIRALARPGVTVLGAVDDLAPIYGRLRLTVAPLRYGSGVKGKVLNSLGAGVPCVMSPMAAEGIGLSAPLDRLVDADPARFAALVCRLHADEAAHGIAVRAGLAFIRKQHGAAAVDAALRAAIADNAPRVRHAAAARTASAAGPAASRLA